MTLQNEVEDDILKSQLLKEIIYYQRTLQNEIFEPHREKGRCKISILISIITNDTS